MVACWSLANNPRGNIMKRIALAGVGLLLATSLTACADPFANAMLQLEVNGSPGIVGESVELNVTVGEVVAEKVVKIQEQIDGGDWVDIETVTLGETELTAVATDQVDAAGSLVYRAILLSSADGEQRAEFVSAEYAPISLTEYVEQNLSLELSMPTTPDASGYLFSGDQVQVQVGVNFGGAADLDIKLSLDYSGAAIANLASDLEASGTVDWNVATDSTTGEKGQLILSAEVLGASGTALKEQRLDVVVVNAEQAFLDHAAELNSANSQSQRRALALAAGGDMFVDTESQPWRAGEQVTFTFEEPFIGEVKLYEPVFQYEVPRECAPGGVVSAMSMPGRGFLLEVAAGDSEFVDTIFGYFDGEQVLVSTAWRFCLG